MTLPAAILDAFFDEATKLAAMTEEEARRKRHAYYVANRQRMIQQGRTYRQEKRVEISRKKKRYNRQVAMGTKRQRKRVQTGGMSFAYMGYK